MTDTSRIRVNLSAVESNLRIVREIVGPDCVICPVVKADGYGLGAAPIAKHLTAAGAGMLAVYTPAQAAELARAALGGPILVLLPVRELARLDEAYRLLIRGDLHLTVHDHPHLDERETANPPRSCVHQLNSLNQIRNSVFGIPLSEIRYALPYGSPLNNPRSEIARHNSTWWIPNAPLRSRL